MTEDAAPHAELRDSVDRATSLMRVIRKDSTVTIGTLACATRIERELLNLSLLLLEVRDAKKA